ncbi:unnamed protein product [Microthlaspi erraticum]|uniref:Uncharacterized protein n=1 Tax=Microthlaspi erraticum TaxID=1685480 RepID=A0A6D2JC87_9BRAS|nr:unnamed protein product [Microthlaspi erraticum]
MIGREIRVFEASSMSHKQSRAPASGKYSELMAKEGPEVMIGDGPEGDRSNRMAKQARRNRALSKRKQSA